MLWFLHTPTLPQVAFLAEWESGASRAQQKSGGAPFGTPPRFGG